MNRERCCECQTVKYLSVKIEKKVKIRLDALKTKQKKTMSRVIQDLLDDTA